MTALIFFFATIFTSFAPVVPNGSKILVKNIIRLDKIEHRNKVFQTVSLYVTVPDGVNMCHIEYMYDLAIELHLPLDIIFRQIKQESNFNPEALSPKGAYGYTQLMPGTYKEEYLRHGFSEEFIDIDNPYINIYIGFHYLRKQWDRWGRWDYALAAYNAGPGRVIQYGGVPPFQETRDYIQIIYGT